MGRRESERYAIRAFSIPGDPTISEPGTELSLIYTATIWETISWMGMSRAGPIKQANPTVRAGQLHIKQPVARPQVSEMPSL